MATGGLSSPCEDMSLYPRSCAYHAYTFILRSVRPGAATPRGYALEFQKGNRITAHAGSRSHKGPTGNPHRRGKRWPVCGVIGFRTRRETRHYPTVQMTRCKKSLNVRILRAIEDTPRWPRRVSRRGQEMR